MDAQMAGDLVAFAAPVTKWSTMVLDPSSLLRVLRRAVKIAATPPMGPVYVCLPMDVLDAPVSDQVRPTGLPSTRVVPEEALVKEAARLLAAADNPVIFTGDGVAFSGAQEELTRVAELLGAPVWEADAGEVNMSYSHPLRQGMTGHMFGHSSLPITSQADVNLICGTYVLPEVFPELGNIFAPGAKVIHVDLDASEIGKNHPVDLGMLGDPKLSLEALGQALQATMTPKQKAAAQARAARLATIKEKKNEKQLEQDKAGRDTVPIRMSRFMEELAPLLPDDTIIFDEALTNSPPVTNYCPPVKAGQYFLTRGGSLGVGIPGAIGAKLAHPDKTVFGFTGDGGSMYTIQALWTARRHNVDAKFVVCNNGSYRLLQLNIEQYWKERGIERHDFPLSFDLSYPAIRFDQIAQSMGVQAVRVEKPWEIASAVRQAVATPGPFLIDLVLESDTHPERVGSTCGQ
jgi:benzoylformate decarboxylase